MCETYIRRAVQRVAEVLLRYGQLTLKDIISYCGRPRLAGSHNPLQAKPIVLKPESVRAVWGFAGAGVVLTFAWRALCQVRQALIALITHNCVRVKNVPRTAAAAQVASSKTGRGVSQHKAGFVMYTVSTGASALASLCD